MKYFKKYLFLILLASGVFVSLQTVKAQSEKCTREDLKSIRAIDGQIKSAAREVESVLSRIERSPSRIKPDEINKSLESIIESQLRPEFIEMAPVYERCGLEFPLPTRDSIVQQPFWLPDQ